MGIVNPESFGEDIEMNGLSIVLIIVSIILAIVMFVLAMALSLALKAAYFRIVKKKDLQLNESDDYFLFLKKKYIKKTITLGVMMVGIILVSLMLFIIPFFYVIVPISYMVVTYAMNPDLEVSDIIKIGFRLGNKKWLLTFALVVVAWFLSSIVGFLMCMVGIYVTQQFINLPFYQVYKDVVGFDEETEIDRIGTL
jgi:hypothetical protein